MEETVSFTAPRILSDSNSRELRNGRSRERSLMHVVLKDGLPVLVDAKAGAKLLSCEIKFPFNPIANQLIGPGEAWIRYSVPSGDEFLSTVPFKVKS